jgi:leucyl-tRNA synthetase
VAAGDVVHRRQRARGAAPHVFALHNDGAARHGALDFEEPFTRFRAHGHIIREGAKMSKTKGNIVIPDVYYEQWGADSFRMYLMFLGPFQEGGDFRDAGISGVRSFLNRCGSR